ncbi:MAG: STAS domain-containing protein [Candidatus Marinamargulisbacteria bacterium]
MNTHIDIATNTITVSGRIDTLTAPEFESKLLPRITKTSPKITIACHHVDYISSTGLRVFILAKQKCRLFNGAVVITGLDDFLKDIFDVSGLTELFEFD